MVPGALTGFVDKLTREADGTLRLGGWAVDAAGLQVPERILFFTGGELIGESSRFIARGDVAEQFAAPELLMSGFEHQLPGDSPVESLVVIAISRNGQASQLTVLPSGG